MGRAFRGGVHQDHRARPRTRASTSSTPADVYSQGESEEIVGGALAKSGRREEVVLATKVHGVMGEGPNQRGNSRRWIFQAVEDSLRRLCTDWIDLYQIHRPDPDTDIEEYARRADRPRTAGQGPLRRQLHLPRPPAGRGALGGRAARPRAGSCASSRRTPCWCAASRPTCCRGPEVRHGAIVWSPLAGGWLSGRYRQGRRDAAVAQGRAHPRALRPVAAGQPAQAGGRGTARGGWLRKRADADPPGPGLHPAASRVSSAIIGPRTMEHLEVSSAPTR
ncbi:aldo/keto reductase [Nonomuraea dietziae]|uniref:aldo/keto reductase n=1 Tax=Nonomuraea dietziae TaxID=65515 RepID=UPI0031E32205